ncbi:hypothetical protein D3C87_1404460 [compost metagenome]
MGNGDRHVFVDLDVELGAKNRNVSIAGLNMKWSGRIFLDGEKRFPGKQRDPPIRGIEIDIDRTGRAEFDLRTVCKDNRLARADSRSVIGEQIGGKELCAHDNESGKGGRDRDRPIPGRPRHGCGSIAQGRSTNGDLAIGPLRLCLVETGP